MKTFIFAFILMSLFSTKLHAQQGDFQDFDFSKADSVAALYPDHSIADLKKLSDKLTGPLSTEAEKFRAIYRWVCNNIENDYGLYLKNKIKREKLQDSPEKLRLWNLKLGLHVFRKLLHEHKTICTGYAYLVKELAYHAGINCEIVDGYGRTAQANVGGRGVLNHSWNAVRLDDQWYLCDATWSSGSVDPQQAKFVKQFNDAYFLASPSLFVRNHYPLDTSRMLLKQKPTLREFLDGPLIYKSAFNYETLPIFPTDFHITAIKGEMLTFRFSGKDNLAAKKAELRVGQTGTTSSVFPKVYQHSDGLYAVGHAFTRKGIYIVHLLLNGEHVFTYKIEVTAL